MKNSLKNWWNPDLLHGSAEFFIFLQQVKYLIFFLEKISYFESWKYVQVMSI